MKASLIKITKTNARGKTSVHIVPASNQKDFERLHDGQKFRIEPYVQPTSNWEEAADKEPKAKEPKEPKAKKTE